MLYYRLRKIIADEKIVYAAGKKLGDIGKKNDIGITFASLPF